MVLVDRLEQMRFSCAVYTCNKCERRQIDGWKRLD